MKKKEREQNGSLYFWEGRKDESSFRKRRSGVTTFGWNGIITVVAWAALSQYFIHKLDFDSYIKSEL